jgi:hypothetical protein
MGLGCLELAGLVDSGVNASVGGQLFNAFEAMDVADLAQDGSTSDRSNAGDGSDVLRDLIHQFGQGSIKLGNLLLQQIDLLQQAMHLDAYSVDQEAHSDGLPSRVLNGFGLGLTEASPAGAAQQFAELGQVKVAIS